MKKGVLRNFTKFTGKHLCQRLFIKKETLAQVFSCVFCAISKNTFFIEHLRTTTSVPKRPSYNFWHCKIAKKISEHGCKTELKKTSDMQP